MRSITSEKEIMQFAFVALLEAFGVVLMRHFIVKISELFVQ